MVIVSLIYAENMELVRAKPDLSWKERIKDFCLYQHQEETKILLSAETFSIHSPTFRSLLHSAWAAVPHSRGADPPKPSSQCPALPVEGFSFSQHQAPITQAHIFFAFL